MCACVQSWRAHFDRGRSEGLELVDALLRVALADVLERLELVDAAPLVLLVDPVIAHQLRRVHRALQVARDLLQHGHSHSRDILVLFRRCPEAQAPAMAYENAPNQLLLRNYSCGEFNAPVGTRYEYALLEFYCDLPQRMLLDTRTLATCMKSTSSPRDTLLLLSSLFQRI